jgi:hypothetical protein
MRSGSNLSESGTRGIPAPPPTSIASGRQFIPPLRGRVHFAVGYSSTAKATPPIGGSTLESAASNLGDILWDCNLALLRLTFSYNAPGRLVMSSWMHHLRGLRRDTVLRFIFALRERLGEIPSTMNPH